MPLYRCGGSNVQMEVLYKQTSLTSKMTYTFTKNYPLVLVLYGHEYTDNGLYDSKETIYDGGYQSRPANSLKISNAQSGLVITSMGASGNPGSMIIIAIK